jgi:hypothetical protein
MLINDATSRNENILVIIIIIFWSVFMNLQCKVIFNINIVKTLIIYVLM